MVCIFFLTRYAPKPFLSLYYSNHTYFIRGIGLFMHSQQSWAQELMYRQKTLQETYKPTGISRNLCHKPHTSAQIPITTHSSHGPTVFNRNGTLMVST